MCIFAQVRAKDKSHRDELLQHLARAIGDTSRRSRDPYLNSSDSNDEEDADDEEEEAEFGVV